MLIFFTVNILNCVYQMVEKRRLNGSEWFTGGGAGGLIYNATKYNWSRFWLSARRCSNACRDRGVTVPTMLPSPCPLRGPRSWTSRRGRQRRRMTTSFRIRTRPPCWGSPGASTAGEAAATRPRCRRCSSRDRTTSRMSLRRTIKRSPLYRPSSSSTIRESNEVNNNRLIIESILRSIITIHFNDEAQ